ncbi:3-dehydroquinate synthase [Helicobacter sp. 16-1353]|uniref:3-dehydroquinate synthase n=1 Tax=Helicobacter sp. 16-1353 TaxID=2004996 RepID=UPI000DCC4367|nr:3-dehydroquinate synthase [Helicobacter sp. 16-1353]RAX52242.1 3-dehydroquinate synthase [Helicobacter sp. 16-1353]
MTKTIQVNTKDRDYKVHIGHMPEISFEGKVLIVTNPKVCGLHIEKLLSNIKANSIYICTVKDGEQYKNLQSIEEILNNAFNHKLDRKSLIIAFGGGVIGDMSGFAAGIYQRGIDFIVIPTTVLSQVDASVGGKTGINNAFGKNLIGLFHQPKAVYIDIDFLSTLPKREFNAGISEIIKMAVCFDGDFFNWLENVDLIANKNDLEYAIYQSIKIKANIVSQDERENGIRAGLNYGHTFGHIIELFGDYSLYLHGEAVSLGICKANNLAINLGKLSLNDAQRIKKLLSKFHLPIDYKVENPQEFYSKFFLDKKSQNDNLRFIIPNGIGKMEIIENPPKEILFNALCDVVDSSY